MSSIWDKMCEVFTSLVRPTRRKTRRVTFSPSTLHRELVRHIQLSASRNPFFNFLAEVRMKANGGQLMHPDCGSMASREMARIAKTAGLMWNSMTDEQKKPYRNIAIEQRKLKRLRRRRSYLTSRKRKKRKPPVECKCLLPPQPTVEEHL